MGFDPQSQIRLVEITAPGWNGDDFGSAHFRDVMSYATESARFPGAFDRPTIRGHETHHLLLAEVANGVFSDRRFFYLERGVGFWVPAPAIRQELSHRNSSGHYIYLQRAFTDLATVRRFVPRRAQQIAHSRFRIYLQDKSRVHQGVLYLFDEWNAYLASARIASESYRSGRLLQQRGNQIPRIDALDGMVDFLYFCSASVLALAESEPGYLATNSQLKAMYALFAEATVYRLAVDGGLRAFQGFHARELMEHFQSAPDNQRIRDYLKSWLGAAWTGRVLRF